VNNVFFRKSSIILFLNKRDLFEEKVRRVPIQSIPDFADYSGPPANPQAGIDYFLRKLLERNKSLTGHQIYHHVTCATDTRNIRAVFDASRDIILKTNLRNSGFLDED
jgi:guanine nucleotide-binding protein G(i) subunit alpha